MNASAILLITAAAILCLTGIILFARWVYLDAKSRGVNPWPWVLLVLLISPNFIGLVIYALVRPKNQYRETCVSCGADIPQDCKYCPNCGVTHVATQLPMSKKGPGPKFIIIGIALIAAGLIMLITTFAVQLAADGSLPIGSYTIGSVGSKWGNTWNMSFHTLQGKQTNIFTSKSDNPHIVYSSRIDQGELSIEVFDQSDTLIAKLPVNQEGILTDLVTGTRYKVVVTGQKARGSFDLKME